MRYRPNTLSVIGARGFVGSAILERAVEEGIDARGYRHDEVPLDVELGTIVYCSGLASGADRAPLDAYRQHVAALIVLLRNATYERVVYVSSTRVYDHGNGTHEDDSVAFRPFQQSDTYALSKAAGEGLVLSANANNRVVRLSNVYGPSLRSELFLSDILRQAARSGKIALRSSLESSKDYVSVRDAAELILKIASSSEQPIYNIAAGRNTTHRQLIEEIQRWWDVKVEIAAGAPTIVVPAIDVSRTQGEFPFQPMDVVNDMKELLHAFAQ